MRGTMKTKHKSRPLYVVCNGERYNATKVAAEFKSGKSIERLGREFDLWEPQVQEIIRRVMRREDRR